MQASSKWLSATGAGYGIGHARSGLAHLRHYTAEYREWGEGPPLVLVPGLAGGIGLVGPLALKLAEHFRVISYQLRGEDDCFLMRRRFGLDDLVGDLAEFMNWHSLENPILFGVSFGGAIALDFASRFPHRVSALAIQGVGARFESSPIKQVAGLVLSRYPLPSDNPFINQFFQVLFGRPQEQGPLFEFVTRQCWRTDQSVMAHRFHLVESLDLTRKLPSISAPTLVMAGDRDMLVSKRSLSELCTGLPCVRRVNLKGAGHLAFVTQAERVAQITARFVQESVGT